MRENALGTSRSLSIVCSVSLSLTSQLAFAPPPHLSLCVHACTDYESRCVDLSQLNTSAAVAAIVSDQIDILVDLTGNTAGNRLDVFAASPAPIQVPCASFAFVIVAALRLRLSVIPVGVQANISLTHTLTLSVIRLSIQVTWIGYPNTTGLSTIHYRVTDAVADPVDTS